MAPMTHQLLRAVALAIALECIVAAEMPVCEVSNVTEAENPRLCNGGSGVFLPAYPTWESQQSTGGRIVVYLIGLLWVFCGVALLADAFMAAIEVITSEEVVKNDGHRDFKVLVWNPTVANLTLMALGSSAPEIVLAVIEILSNDMFTGDLGPSTIVGSAAFNLLVIIGICIMSIPKRDVDPHKLGFRRVKQKTVLLVTAFNSVFAYVWLLFILMGPSPDLIEPWEGVMTFMFCPIMVIIAYLADKGYFDDGDGEVADAKMNGIELGNENLSPGEVFQRLKDFAKQNNMAITDVNPELASQVLFANDVGNVRTTRAQYRHGVIDQLLHGGKANVLTQDTMNRRLQEMKASHAPPLPETTVGFASVMNIVQENVEGGVVKLDVVHKQGEVTCGNQVAFMVDFETVDGDAVAGVKYERTSGTLHFGKEVSSQVVSVPIIDNDIEEDDQFFTVVLSNLRVTSGKPGLLKINPAHDTAVVTILDDDKPGQISMATSKLNVSEDAGQGAEIVLVRKHGCRGELSVLLKTEDGTAVAPADYKALPPAGLRVTFLNGEMEKTIHIPVVDDEGYEKNEMFTVTLEPDTGQPDSIIDLPKFTEVTILDNDKVKNLVEQATKYMGVNHDRYALGKSVWKTQIWEAVKWPDDPGWAPAVVHIILVFWKLFAALIPPTLWFGGRLAFVVALVYIALVTAFIGDLAAMFGCVMGLSDAVTAITFVALGTSLPDCFASRTAAINDKTADASIGNVTGSNAVNVYLGLGLPWMIAAIYWRLEGPTCKWQAKYPGAVDNYSKGGFYVPAGNLGFTVGVFCGCAVVAFLILLFRRSMTGAELGTGGPDNMGDPSSATYGGMSLIFLWFIFVTLSSLQSEKMI